MVVYFNNEEVVSFNRTLDAETVRAELVKTNPAIQNATYELKDGNLYFYKDAKKLG